MNAMTTSSLTSSRCCLLTEEMRQGILDLFKDPRKSYQRAVIRGHRPWSNAGMQGKAMKYAGSYSDSRSSMARKIAIYLAGHGLEVRVAMAMLPGERPRKRLLIVKTGGPNGHEIVQDWLTGLEPLPRYEVWAIQTVKTYRTYESNSRIILTHNRKKAIRVANKVAKNPERYHLRSDVCDVEVRVFGTEELVARVATGMDMLKRVLEDT
jgi:hypothetical protein